jgi:hypothetical protein
MVTVIFVVTVAAQGQENESLEELNILHRITTPVSICLWSLPRNSEFLHSWSYRLFIFGVKLAGVPILVSCVTLCNLLAISDPHYSPLQNED